ncbi:MAG: HAD family hydrolase [Clostridia bacterium]|nr:HAD family hydrolase [Clostridia bacterium]
MISSVMFDMGGTLEDLYSDESTQMKMAEKVSCILRENGVDWKMSDRETMELVNREMERYKAVSVKTEIELKPEEIWRGYILASQNLPDDVLTEDLCEKLAYAWETTYFVRKLRPNVIPMLSALKDMGVRLAVISNTASLFQVFDTLENYGIRKYFDQVVISSIVSYRKPHVNAFKIALRQMGLSADECVYVGDTVARDVSGAIKAGFAKTIQIYSFLTASRDAGLDGSIKPDYVIEDMNQIPQIVAELRK